MVHAIAEVAVNVPLFRNFHYSVPASLGETIRVGHRVLIPFGARTTTGVCVGFPASTEVPELKPISKVLHPDCRFDHHLLELTQWIAGYYRAGWGEVLEAALPPPIRSGRGERLERWIRRLKPAAALRAEARRVLKKAPARAAALTFLATGDGQIHRSVVLKQAPATAAVIARLIADGWIEETRSRKEIDLGAAPQEPGSTEGGPESAPAAPLTLHPDQERAIEEIKEALEARTFRTILLAGVTGSGKTEVYLRALRTALERGQRGLVLVPEISLTPQTVLRFQRGLAVGAVSVLHSMLSTTERRAHWRNIQDGAAKLVIGARSSIFAPVKDLGLIIVDEEHDGSYKQDSAPRYNARDVAIVRARMLGIPVVLGSATPTLESAWNARSGKYRLLKLPRRATSHDLPSVHKVALGPEFYRRDGSGLIADNLDYRIRKTLGAKEQVVLFLNRRGFATYLHCIRCSFVLKCEDCDIALTFHRQDDSARCHYCGYHRNLPRECPDCRTPGLRRSGAGTEKITTVLDKRYPGARVLQLDRDTVGTYHDLRDSLARFGRGEYDILVGTQMVAKGHDFPNVTLVGIVNADMGLHFPDFRAAERTFQLVTQVSGRAGRGKRPGHVVVQTFCPEHYAIDYAARAEFDGFLEKELANRKPLAYPPFGRLVKVQLQGADQEVVEKEAKRAAERLREASSASEEIAVRVLGPAPSPLAKVQGKYRFQILLKSPTHQGLQNLLRSFDDDKARPRRGVERLVDVDPQSML